MRRSQYTVAELIEELQKHDPSRVVVLARDAEGNGFRELYQVVTSAYKDGETGIEALTPELRKQGYCAGDVMKNGEKAVVLWPS
jgi:hypothetical protein